MSEPTPITERIAAYLAGGGLFNPELANHDAVRDLLIDCRAELAAARAAEKSLREEVGRLRGLINGDANLIRVDTTHGIDMQLEHPMVALMADSLAKMIGGHNYVEMRMTHKETGDEYTCHLQRTSRPTPHELRLRAEERAAQAEAREDALRVLLTEALQVLPARGDLRRRIIQTIDASQKEKS